ncbi:MAG: hypothetical protein IJ607_08205 [Bacteroidaceae bacterium]|nr:hypothetical protein [Bacteroidaceae bacterium]
MTLQQINAQNTKLWQDIGSIADNESLMKRLARYVAKLVKEKENSAIMTKEEYMAKLERAEQESKNGEGMTMLPGENLSDFLKRNGYEL